MTIDATFWVAVSFFLFFGGLVYLKVPQKINTNLTEQIDKIKKELDEADKLKVESKNLLSNYENKIDKSKKEVQNILNSARHDSEKSILETTEKFHKLMENKKKNLEQKINQMKNNSIKEIKNTSVKISINAVEHLLNNSIDKSKLEKLYSNSLNQAKTSLKNIRI